MRPAILCALLMLAGLCQCRHLRHHAPSEDASSDRSLQQPRLNMTHNVPYGYKKLDKMLKKAILKIILGDLRPSDMAMLKALNYTAEDIMAIRDHELSRLREQKLDGKFATMREHDSSQKLPTMHRRSSYQQDLSDEDIEAFNRKAIFDYENGLTATQAPEDDFDEPSRGKEEDAAVEDTFHLSFDKAMEPHVVFKIRYDDSEFDSDSNERSAAASRTSTPGPFHAPGDADPSKPGDLEALNRQAVEDYETNIPELAGSLEERKREFSTSSEERRYQPRYDYNEAAAPRSEERNDTSAGESSSAPEEYEGLERVEGDVYRVKEEAMQELLRFEEEQMRSDEESDEASARMSYGSMEDVFNDTMMEYQNDGEAAPEGNFTEGQNQNLTAYQRLALAQRRDQKQMAMEDIKQRVLAITGRLTPSSGNNNNNNQVTRERLRMFSPSCQMPRNTEAEAWSDPYSMNMHFQLNLTSSEHVVAAKLRLFALPQTSAATQSAGNEEEEEDEKKIRISIYFYTKSLKKHRVKKRLMDSVVMPLTSQGSHLAMDVRQALRFWRPNTEQHQQQQQQQSQQPQPQHGTGHSSNHGLVVQVEDQDGKPLKPALYIQEPSCPEGAASNGTDEKAFKFGPALYVRTCTRYLRFVDGKYEMYVVCSPTQRH